MTVNKKSREDDDDTATLLPTSGGQAGKLNAVATHDAIS
jgi:hypothetical protein